MITNDDLIYSADELGDMLKRERELAYAAGYSAAMAEAERVCLQRGDMYSNDLAHAKNERSETAILHWQGEAHRCAAAIAARRGPTPRTE